jgi:hypothetical protein
MKTKKLKFIFKTDKPKGAYAFVHVPHHRIKLNKKEVGSIDDKKPHAIRFMVIKKDINEDGNPHCSWKWITLKHESETLQDAKDFLNENVEAITNKYNLRMSDD